MKLYYLIVSLLAIVGVTYFLTDYPYLIGFVGFGIAIGYRNEIDQYNKKNSGKS